MRKTLSILLFFLRENPLNLPQRLKKHLNVLINKTPSRHLNDTKTTHVAKNKIQEGPQKWNIGWNGLSKETVSYPGYMYPWFTITIERFKIIVYKLLSVTMISTSKKSLPVIPFSSAIFLTFLSSKKSIKYLFIFPMEKEEKKSNQTGENSNLWLITGRSRIVNHKKPKHCKHDVTRDDWQQWFLVQHTIAMLEQCCNNIGTLCYPKNRQCELHGVRSGVGSIFTSL